MPPKPPTPSAPVKTVGEKFIELAKTLQFAWFFGHVVVLISSLLFVISGKPFFYRLAYAGVIESFGIINYQHFHLKPKAKDTELNLVNLLTNENVLYTSLSVFWFLTPPIRFTLLPFLIFSLFHSLNYLKNNLLPKVFSISVESNNRAVVYIDQFVKQYNERCISLVGSIELNLLLLLIVRFVFLYSRSFITLAVYLLFIKLRYENSKYMKSNFAQWRVRLDGLFSHPQVPPAVKLYYSKFKDLLFKVSAYNLSTPVASPAKKE
ncbi:hypothetical protein TPHA_0K02080 [Tetrapisispora phaffii CBS 4417]|uniref:Nucleoporin POM33 n=1 Tax=Tetrapisispora phaffii (strain ATCC 24235 / CBS 4417 / NBRC 1672 / NRRL Y-8282 / UCD 70-5) TaxID=1071381 RepID=G8BZL3_TETPH|nr:hypothetical protein TPHA_0K02080 [Tetrapisispora phaffii CBS 4417]CCE65341.1 hypothetical protein TPHA_0K02080 [Tetrapisispora phaffii CBS 4417]